MSIRSGVENVMHNGLKTRLKGHSEPMGSDSIDPKTGFPLFTRKGYAVVVRG